ncbi:uncharacterized protein LOC144347217 [Saccoglossus kowalevskii]
MSVLGQATSGTYPESGGVTIAGVDYIDGKEYLPRANDILKHTMKYETDISKRREMQASMVTYTDRTRQLLKERGLYDQGDGDVVNSTKQTHRVESNRRVFMSSITASDMHNSLSLTSKYFSTKTHLNRKGINAGMPSYSGNNARLPNILSASDPTGYSFDIVRRGVSRLPAVDEGESNSPPEIISGVNTNKTERKAKKIRTRLVYLKDESQTKAVRKAKKKLLNWVREDEGTLRINVQLPTVEYDPESPARSLISELSIYQCESNKVSGCSSDIQCIMCKLENCNDMVREHDGEGDAQNDELRQNENKEQDDRQVPMFDSDRLVDDPEERLSDDAVDKNTGTSPESSDEGHNKHTTTSLKKKMKKKARASIIRKTKLAGTLPESTATYRSEVRRKRAEDKRLIRHYENHDRPKLAALPIKNGTGILDIDTESYHRSYKIIHRDPPSVKKIKTWLESNNLSNSSPGDDDNGDVLRTLYRSGGTLQDDNTNHGSEAIKQRSRLSLKADYVSNSTALPQNRDKTTLGESHRILAKKKDQERSSRYTVMYDTSSNPSKYPGGTITLSDVTSFVDESFMHSTVLEDKRSKGRVRKLGGRNGEMLCIHGNKTGSCHNCQEIEEAEVMLGKQIENFTKSNVQWSVVSDGMDRSRWGRSRLVKGPQEGDAPVLKHSADKTQGDTAERSLAVPSIASGVEFTNDASMKSYLEGLNDDESVLSAFTMGKRRVRFTEHVEVHEIALYRRDPNKPLRKPRRGKKKKALPVHI